MGIGVPLAAAKGLSIQPGRDVLEYGWNKKERLSLCGGRNQDELSDSVAVNAQACGWCACTLDVVQCQLLRVKVVEVLSPNDKNFLFSEA